MRGTRVGPAAKVLIRLAVASSLVKVTKWPVQI